MGVVYRAFDVKLERTVALKFLPEHLLYSAEEKKRVLREARTASSLDHPNIGVIHGFEETDSGRVFIVMAYYEGESLAQKMHRGPLAVTEAVDIAIQMAEGLGAAHAGAVVHRDIKPANVLITKSGMVKIVDFGLARLSATVGSTQSISSGGTVGYMSPEQAMGKIVDQRTDIWSLGITLAEMLTGKHPFLRDSAAATVIAILNEAPQGVDGIPVDLLRIIYRALAKEPDTRYQSCEELLGDLKDFHSQLERASPMAKPPSSSKDAAKQLRSQLAAASRPTFRSVDEPTSKGWIWLVVLGVVAVLIAALSFVTPVRERVVGLFGHPEDHIAVLPFDNIGGDPAMEAVSQGLMDSMTDELSNLSNVQKSLWVVPSSVVRSRKITDPMTAAKELGATLVVRGSIQRIGQSVHLSVNLIDAKNMRQIGAAAMDDSAGDIEALQNEAVSRLARLMNIKVSAEALKATGGNVQPAAYESYLKALGFMQRYDKPGNLDQAIAALGSSVGTDSRFALGYAQLGEAYRLKYQLDKNPKWLDEAQANCQKAAEIDSSLPAAYVTLGRIHESNGKNDLALQEFKKAIQINPRSGEALRGLARTYENTGHQQEAEAAFVKSAALQPDYWDGYDELGLYYDRQTKYLQAIEQLKHAAELTPDNAQVFSNLGAVYIDWNDANALPEAEKALKKSIELTPSYAAYANLAALLYNQRRYSEAAANWEAALKLNDRNYLLWGFLGNAYEWMTEDAKAEGTRERMLPLLEQQVKLQPQDADAQAYLASTYAKKGMREKALVRLQAALALAPESPGVLENAGVVYENLGDHEQAVKYIEKSMQKGNALDDLKNDPDLQKVLSDPKFQTLGKK
jgi:serine/threonine protein kinase/tetratricopeptide (TPR) repeat protein